MATVTQAIVMCGVCGATQELAGLGSTSAFGAPDLDLRPVPQTGAVERGPRAVTAAKAMAATMRLLRWRETLERPVAMLLDRASLG